MLCCYGQCALVLSPFLYVYIYIFQSLELVQLAEQVCSLLCSYEKFVLVLSLSIYVHIYIPISRTDATR